MDLRYFLHDPSLRSLAVSLGAEPGAQIERDIAYGSHARLRLDIYRPDADFVDETNGAWAPRPVVLFFYGGSWETGDKSDYAFVGSALAARGFTTAIADYRIFPDVTFPDFLHDCVDAYRWVREHLADEAPVVLMGHSAGAYNAAFLSCAEWDAFGYVGDDVPRPDAFVGLAGPYAFDPLSWEGTRHIFPTIQTADEARPIAFAGPSTPPTLLLHGDGDDLVKPWNSRELRKALLTHDVPVSIKIYDRVGHVGLVMSMAAPLRWRASVLEDVATFLAGIDDYGR